MEDYLQDWSADSTSVLEPLQPLSVDWVENKASNTDTKVELFSRGETAGRLLAELDKLKDETESYYNWNETEKFQLPIFEDYTNTGTATAVFNDDLNFNIADFPASYDNSSSSSINNNNNSSSNSSNFSVNVQPQCQQQQPHQQRQIQAQVQTRQGFRCNELTSASLTPPHQFNSTLEDYKDDQEEPFYNDVLSPSIIKQQQQSTSSKQNQQQELLLTPPSSPKEEEILKFLEEMSPDVLEQFLKSDVNNSMSVVNNSNSHCSDGSSEFTSGVQEEDFASDYVSSPFMSSDSGMDEQVNSPINVLRVTMMSSSEDVIASSPSSSCSDDGHQTYTEVLKQRRRGANGGYKPYSRVGAGEEKKLRKKEQNKNAATRYRMKKKAEVELVQVEEGQLETRNKELRENLNEICREIKYLKSLMKDVYKAKGLIKK